MWVGVGVIEQDWFGDLMGREGRCKNMLFGGPCGTLFQRHSPGGATVRLCNAGWGVGMRLLWGFDVWFRRCAGKGHMGHVLVLLVIIIITPIETEGPLSGPSSASQHVLVTTIKVLLVPTAFNLHAAIQRSSA